MAWFYISDGTSYGPVAESELRRLRENRTLSPDTLVWTAGMSEWAPFQKSGLAAATPSISHGTSHTCAECGQAYAETDMLQYENNWVCAACKPVFFQRLKEGLVPQGVLVYGSVGRRLVAFLVDGFIMLFGIGLCLIPFLITATWVVGTNHQTVDQGSWFGPLILLAEIGVPAAYEIIMIRKYGATFGKMLMRLKVVTAAGIPLSYGRATGRYFAKILSGMTFYIGYIIAFFDDEKRTLHDHVCSTRVIVT